MSSSSSSHDENLSLPPPSKRSRGNPRRKSPVKPPAHPHPHQHPLQDHSNLPPSSSSSSSLGGNGKNCSAAAGGVVVVVRPLQKSPSLVVEESDAELMEMGLHRIVVDASGDAALSVVDDLSEDQGPSCGPRGDGGSLGRTSSSEEKRLRLLGQQQQEQQLYRQASPALPPPRRFRIARRSSVDLLSMLPSAASNFQGPNYFDLLSDEIVIQVLKWLPKVTLVRVAQVCKRFRTVSIDEVFWRRLDLGLKALPAGVIGQVLQRGVTLLRAARASMASPICSPSFPANLQSKLQYLDLSVASIAVPDLEQLLSACYGLRKLAMENLQISETVCRRVAQNPALNTLHLGMTRGITEDGIVAILRGCRQLRELNVGWTEMDSATTAALVKNLNVGVERLNISGGRETLTDLLVEYVVSRCSRLIELDVSDALNLTPKSVGFISSGLYRLESLSASRCYNIIPAAYLELESCPALRYLNVFGGVPEVPLAELKKRLPKIEINKFLFTSIARPTVGIKRTSIWGLRVRD